MSAKQPRRCGWVDEKKPDYVAYHDEEWGVPVRDERHLFELLTLEGAQAGLSWYTVLRKREHYREAFEDFDVARVARFDRRRIEKLLKNDGLIRNRLKIESTVTNARAFLEVQDAVGSFSEYFWSFVGGSPKVNAPRKLADVPAKTAEAERASKDMKKRGFRFVGPTIVYAYMQSAGLVNDHVVGCFRRREIIDAV